nr:hypothetical protein [Anaerolineae bacterium]
MEVIEILKRDWSTDQWIVAEGVTGNMSGLSNDDTLNPGEEDFALLSLYGVECERWDLYKVRMRVSYATVDGEAFSKESELNVVVER